MIAFGYYTFPRMKYSALLDKREHFLKRRRMRHVHRMRRRKRERIISFARFSTPMGCLRSRRIAQIISGLTSFRKSYCRLPYSTRSKEKRYRFMEMASTCAIGFMCMTIAMRCSWFRSEASPGKRITLERETSVRRCRWSRRSVLCLTNGNRRFARTGTSFVS